MEGNDLGRLVRTLSEKCPRCERPLQIRARKIIYWFKNDPLDKEVEYIACSNPSCEYEREMEQKKREHRPDKYSSVPAVIEWRGSGNRKSSRFGTSDRATSKKGDRRGDRRNT